MGIKVCPSMAGMPKGKEGCSASVSGSRLFHLLTFTCCKFPLLSRFGRVFAVGCCSVAVTSSARHADYHDGNWSKDPILDKTICNFSRDRN
jgi:hypothetical protein